MFAQGRKVGGQPRLETHELAGCYFLSGVLSTPEDVIAPFASVTALSTLLSHREGCTCREERKGLSSQTIEG